VHATIVLHASCISLLGKRLFLSPVIAAATAETGITSQGERFGTATQPLQNGKPTIAFSFPSFRQVVFQVVHHIENKYLFCLCRQKLLNRAQKVQ
jgi:hypothetical protein